MFQSIDISTTALVAQRVRMNVAAMNLANIDSVDSPDGGPYQRRSVIFQAGKDGSDRGGGVHVSAIEKQAVFRTKYDPSHPYADANGYVKLPGIDAITETINMMEAQRAYEASIAAIDVSKAMMNGAIKLLA